MAALGAEGGFETFGGVSTVWAEALECAALAAAGAEGDGDPTEGVARGEGEEKEGRALYPAEPADRNESLRAGDGVEMAESAGREGELGDGGLGARGDGVFEEGCCRATVDGTHGDGD